MLEFSEISAVVTQYFDGLYEGDIATLSRIFHERSRLHFILDGKLEEIEFAPYMEVVRNRPSPQSLGAERRDEVVAVSQTSSDTAFVVVSLLLAGKSYTDQLSLLKDSGRWQIMSKIYHLNNPAA